MEEYINVAVIGGILLNIGAYYVYKGKIFNSVVTYLFADICWIIMAFDREDWMGMGFITVGTTLGFLAFLKMNKGTMKKDL
jgi:hypothetical protein